MLTALFMIFGLAVGYVTGSQSIPRTCDNEELDYAATHESLGEDMLAVLPLKAGAGYAMLYGDHIKGPRRISMYVFVGQERNAGVNAKKSIGQCQTGTGEVLNHYEQFPPPPAPKAAEKEPVEPTDFD